MRSFGLLALGVASLGACAPDIVSDTYLCGPERLCPEGLVCSETSVSCVAEASASEFECTEESADAEPDDSVEDALVLGALDCGSQLTTVASPNLLSQWGCIASSSDVDHFRFSAASCEGNAPHIEIRLQYHRAFAPIYAELLDADQNVVASGTRCTSDSNQGGAEALCLELAAPASGDYRVRIGVVDEENCGGDCDFNRYLLRLSYPLS